MIFQKLVIINFLTFLNICFQFRKFFSLLKPFSSNLNLWYIFRSWEKFQAFSHQTLKGQLKWSVGIACEVKTSLLYVLEYRGGREGGCRKTKCSKKKAKRLIDSEKEFSFKFKRNTDSLMSYFESNSNRASSKLLFKIFHR